MEQDQPYKYLEELNIPLDRLFHAAQEYSYYIPVYLGDTITMTKKIEDIYDKKMEPSILFHFFQIMSIMMI